MLTQALSRLPEIEGYDRAFRMRRAVQCSVVQRPLPKEEWTKPEEVRWWRMGNARHIPWSLGSSRVRCDTMDCELGAWGVVAHEICDLASFFAGGPTFLPKHTPSQ